MPHRHNAPHRRAVLAGLSGLAATAAWPPAATRAKSPSGPVKLTIDGAIGKLQGETGKPTALWSFNGTAPGPEIRMPQGARLTVEVDNRLTVETSVHWHGIRLPNAMDGVPHLTQAPIKQGETFTYEFDLPDAGTYWYHPHIHSAEQVARGLYGALIVEEKSPPRVDRELTWVLSDWRLDKNGLIDGNFSTMMDMSHAGRIGETITINGKKAEPVAVKGGERIRLRLINAATARIFGLVFGDLKPTLIALDGQPITPHNPPGNVLILGPAMRADIILDIDAKPGTTLAIEDKFYSRRPYRLTEFKVGEIPLRDRPPNWPIALAANPVAEPDLASAVHHDIVFQGGMMSTMVERQMDANKAYALPNMRENMMAGRMWFINGKAAEDFADGTHKMQPSITLKRGQTCHMTLTNMTAWFHPIHLHGHTFRVLKRNGQPTPHREWQDTVLMAPRDEVEIAFVADNPGDWMFHCHVLDHQAAGMMTTVRVT